jgi:hypothetical protein
VDDLWWGIIAAGFGFGIGNDIEDIRKKTTIAYAVASLVTGLGCIMIIFAVRITNDAVLYGGLGLSLLGIVMAMRTFIIRKKHPRKS